MIEGYFMCYVKSIGLAMEIGEFLHRNFCKKYLQTIQNGVMKRKRRIYENFISFFVEGKLIVCNIYEKFQFLRMKGDQCQ